MTQRRHLIIGCGSAAVSAAETIRRISPEDEIQLVTMETCDPYSPMSLTYLLGGRITRPNIRLRDAGFFDKIGATVTRGKKVVKLDTKAKAAILDSGERAEYDKLLIATGSDPVKPSLEGLEEVGFQGFHTIKDLERIEDRIRDQKDVLIYGGGLVAMTLTIGLMEKDIQVKVVVRSRILRTYFDEECGGLISQIFQEKGCRIFSGSPVKEIRNNNGGVEVLLDNGTHVQADSLVVAVGVMPRISFLKDTEVDVRRGVVVDRRMQTNVEHIYAAGDVAESPDFFTGSSGLSPILPSAVDQGKIAGANMAGENMEYTGWIPINNFNFFGHRAVSIGISQPAEDGVQVLTDKHEVEKRYKKLVLQHGLLIGASFLNIPLSSGIIQYLIREKVDVEPVKELLLEKPNEVSSWLMQRSEGNLKA